MGKPAGSVTATEALTCIRTRRFASSIVGGPNYHPFADAPDAIGLDRRARQLVADYWSDRVWLTGPLSDVAFTTVCEALERERSLSDAVVVVMTPVRAGVAPAALELSRQPEAAIEVIAAP